VVAQAGVYDDFLAAMTEAVTKTKTRYDPDDEDILYGPINNPNQLRHISDLVSRAPDHARLLAGGKQQGQVGYFYEPTLIADLRPGRRARAEGGLRSGRHGPAVQGRRRGGQVRQRQRIRAGIVGLDLQCWAGGPDGGGVWINTHIPLVAEMPHGGFKHSGYGKDLSMYGFDDYTRIKHVMQYNGFEG